MGRQNSTYSEQKFIDWCKILQVAQVQWVGNSLVILPAKISLQNMIYHIAVHYNFPSNVVHRYHIDTANQMSLFHMYIIYHMDKKFVDRA